MGILLLPPLNQSRRSVDPDPLSPEASEADEAKKKAIASDNAFYTDGTLTFVDIDVEEFRAEVMNISVKKNCTLPQWLERKAVKAGLNFSQVLQEGLKQKLHIA